MIFKRIPTICILFLLLIPLASAISISASPASLNPGGTLSITINDLEDSATFSLIVESAFDVTPGERFEFKTTNFNMPFSLSEGAVSAYTQNTESTKMTVIKDETEYSIAGPSTDGVYTDSQTRDVSSGIYSEISLGGRVLSDKSSIIARFNLAGKKAGSDNSVISFNVEGIQAGTLRVKGLVNNQIQMDQIITIGTPVTALQVSATATSTSAPTAAPTGTATGTTTPTAVAVNQAPASTIIESIDGKARFSAINAGNAIFTLDTVSNIPVGWEKVGNAYAIIMQGLSAASNGKVTFIMPISVVENIDNYNLFIAQYKNGEWIALPSTYSSGTVYASVTEEGTYCVMSTEEVLASSTSQQKETAGLPAFILVISIGLAAAVFSLRKNK